MDEYVVVNIITSRRINKKNLEYYFELLEETGPLTKQEIEQLRQKGEVGISDGNPQDKLEIISSIYTIKEGSV